MINLELLLQFFSVRGGAILTTIVLKFMLVLNSALVLIIAARATVTFLLDGRVLC